MYVQGSANRRVGSTAMNSESSRSHSVFTFVIESRSKVFYFLNLRLSLQSPTNTHELHMSKTVRSCITFIRIDIHLL